MQSHSWRTLNALLVLVAPEQLAKIITVTRRIPLPKPEPEPGVESQAEMPIV